MNLRRVSQKISPDGGCRGFQGAGRDPAISGKRAPEVRGTLSGNGDIWKRNPRKPGKSRAKKYVPEIAAFCCVTHISSGPACESPPPCQKDVPVPRPARFPTRTRRNPAICGKRAPGVRGARGMLSGNADILERDPRKPGKSRGIKYVPDIATFCCVTDISLGPARESSSRSWQNTPCQVKRELPQCPARREPPPRLPPFLRRNDNSSPELPWAQLAASCAIPTSGHAGNPGTLANCRPRSCGISGTLRQTTCGICATPRQTSCGNSIIGRQESDCGILTICRERICEICTTGPRTRCDRKNPGADILCVADCSYPGVMVSVARRSVVCQYQYEAPLESARKCEQAKDR